MWTSANCGSIARMPIWGKSARTIGGYHYSVESSPLVPIVGKALATAGKTKVDVSALSNDYETIRPFVVAFQKQAKLTPDGDAGPNTCRALRDAGAFGPVDAWTATRIVEAGIRIYNYGIVCQVATKDEELGKAVRVWGDWLSNARQRGKAKAGLKVEQKLAANDGTTRVLPIGQGEGRVGKGGVVQLGFVPALALPLIAEGAAASFAADVVAGVGALAAAAAAAWAAVAIGKAAAKARETATENETTISETTPIADSKPDTAPGKPPEPGKMDWNLKGSPKGWLAILGALCAAVAAVVIEGLGVVASLVPIAGAAVGMGLQLAVAAGALLLVWLVAKRKKRRT